ncbi:MAG TPA: hypothetical protein VKG23_19700, partial [Thermoanaerobaculia bacterium]|nr:hypothetical protein [Thermoanaerobaculia bacterium]
MLQKAQLHAYVGGDPLAGRSDPSDVRSVESFQGYVVITFNPSTPALAGRDSRCDAAKRIVAGLGPAPNLYRSHPYPITPYDPDYIDYVDLIESRRKEYQAGRAPASFGGLRIRAKGPFAEKLLGSRVSPGGEAWDAVLEEVDLDDLVGAHRIALDGWLGPPWLKAGWFHTYLLQGAALGDRASRQAVDALYQRLTTEAFADLAERANLERALVSRLISGCERVVVGYRLRRERYAAEFSQGIENIAYDSQAGFDSSIFVRTVKLKDFPWNGWLRLGIATKPAAAWNPIGGFSDPAGRLAWAALGDAAMFPSPYGGSWIDNRVVPTVTTDAASPIAVPDDALVPEPGTGAFRAVGKGKTAPVKITYRLHASAFHDNTRMTAADAVYAYSFAWRWGGRGASGGNEHDPAVEAATAALRRSLVGFKVVRVDSEVKKFSDMTFTYVIPVIEVYLDAGDTDPERLAALAPPWSTVPWHVMVLMEEAVKRGLGAFSADEARRRGVRWLDLVRDPKLQEAMGPLVERFAKEAYVPDVLRRFVTAEEAQTRWSALRQFAQRRRHFLVTNGPYQLDKWSDAGVVLDVFRDFSNPLGVGTFDRFAIPRRAYVSRIVVSPGRLEVYPEIERVEKFLRDYRIIREPLGAPGADEDRSDIPACRYVVVSQDGTVVAAGVSRESQGNRLVVDLKGRLRPGTYTVRVALTLGGNDVDPEVASTQYRV